MRFWAIANIRIRPIGLISSWPPEHQLMITIGTSSIMSLGHLPIYTVASLCNCLIGLIAKERGGEVKRTA